MMERILIVREKEQRRVGKINNENRYIHEQKAMSRKLRNIDPLYLDHITQNDEPQGVIWSRI